MNKLPIVCIAGKNEIAVFGLHILVKTIGRENVRVCLNSDDNNHPSWQPSLSRHAEELGVQVCDLSDLYSQVGLIFLSLEFDKIISPEKFVSNQLFNIHFSMLPAYKGMYTSYWPILNGEKFSHASAIKRCLDHKNVSVISFGVRNISKSEITFLKKNNTRINIFWAKDKLKWNLKKFKKMIKNKTVYLTFDVDGLDSSIMPATGTPGP